MSTPQTDAYWQNQQSIVESYATMVNSMKDPALHMALQTICNDADIHERTKDQCRAIYNTWKDTQLDHLDDTTPYGDDRDEDAEAYKEERESARAEEHYAPSEGFKV